MRGKLPWLALWALLHGSALQGQVSSVARQIFSSDTINAVRATISPDGRWLLFTWYVSEQETRLMILPLAGGEPRLLLPANPRVWYNHPMFTPQGDRILMVSNMPRRSATDAWNYLVAAPFDTRTGTLSGALRQISLEGVRSGPTRFAPAISPDGRFVAYIQGESNGLKVIPLTGGNARLLVPAPVASPGFLAWTADGRSVLYSLPEPQQFVRMRVGVDGGAATVVARYSGQRGTISPDNRYSFVIDRQGAGTKPSRLRLFAADGRSLGEIEVPNINGFAASFSPDGKYIVGATDNSVAPIKVVPVAGGPIRQISPGDAYDWPGGWSGDGNAVEVETVDQGHRAYEVITLRGEVLSKIRLPEDTPGLNVLGIKDGYLVYRAGDPLSMTGWRLMAMSLKDQTKRELARDVIRNGGANPAGGMYYGIVGDEFYYRQLIGGRLQVRAMNLRGESRLLGEFPASLSGTTGMVLYKDRLVYREPVNDSLRLQLVTGLGKTPRTVGTFGKTTPPGEFVWSYDGRRLAVSLGGVPQRLLLYRFDAAGAPEGPPQSFTLPFDYWYETFWLPDGSGLTMIVQPPGKGTTDIALVKLADPMHPILLTSEDPHSKWGHSLSPDGKYVAYPSEQNKGSSIYVIEVAELLKQVKRGSQ